ncbi:MAG: DUF2147 domain-containing protein [Alphaproteobacteria bacterium]|nr:DUF2147 domain-containing protein [Alphaproteobacteria bacterium]
MSLTIRLTQSAALATALLWTASAQAADPKGIWYDHNGRGAVQIKDCKSGKGLCGYVVHVKKKKHAKRCGTQILGNVTSRGGGWIYSPSRGRKYTVRIKRLSDSKLRVVGNASSRLFSKTFTWKKAPDDLELCGKYAVAKKTSVDRDEDRDTRRTSRRDRDEDRDTRRTSRRDRDEDRDTRRTSRRDRDEDRDTRRTSRRDRDEDRDTRRSRRRDRDEDRDNGRLPQSEIEELEAAAARERDEDGRRRYDDDRRDNDRRYEDEDVAATPDEEVEENEDTEGVGNDRPENEVTEVFDRLIDKANEYTGGNGKRRCKLRVPYVDRVIMIPCRDRD